MKQSDSIDKLAGAMCKAQAMMGGAVKDSTNPFFKSSYADLTSVVKAVKEPFAENGLSYVQFPHSTERGVGVTTRLMHTSGQWLESEFVLPMSKNDPQGAGSAITYARRYALQSVAGIPTADDDAEAAMFQARKTIEQWKTELAPSIEMIKAGIEQDNLSAAAEAWFELDDEEKGAIFIATSKNGPFSTKEREIMKSTEFRQAHYGEVV
jgi:hypothetical protein